MVSWCDMYACSYPRRLDIKAPGKDNLPYGELNRQIYLAEIAQSCSLVLPLQQAR
jgi:hypothetical protein